MTEISIGLGSAWDAGPHVAARVGPLAVVGYQVASRRRWPRVRWRFRELRVGLGISWLGRVVVVGWLR